MEPSIVAGSAVELTAGYIAGLSILATVGIISMWAVFWNSVSKSKESISGILKSPSFFKIVTVMGVIAATVILSLAGRLEGSITGAILSGIVGYVLGQMSGKHDSEDKPV